MRRPRRGGHLIIHGGALSSEVVDRFVALGGGGRGHLVYVPTSLEGEVSADAGSVPGFLRPAAFGRVTVLHTRDPMSADSEAFIAPLKKATAIWFSEGRQWRTMDAYLDTKAAAAFASVCISPPSPARRKKGKNAQSPLLEDPPQYDATSDSRLRQRKPVGRLRFSTFDAQPMNRGLEPFSVSAHAGLVQWRVSNR